jgi:hypothetical protein
MPRDRDIVWQHVEELEKPKEPGGASKVRCDHCDLEFQAGCSRIRGHFLGHSSLGVRACTAVPEALAAQLEDQEQKKREKNNKKRKAAELDRLTKSQAAGSAEQSKQSSLHAAFRRQDKSEVDSLWARAVYANGLPFRLVDNSHFKAAVEATCRFGATYKAPTVKALRTTLLQKEKASVEQELESFKEALVQTKGTVTSDGWSDTRHRPLLNVLLVSPKGEKFLKAINTEGEEKNAQYIADRICESIEEIGAEDIIQVVTDSASTCKAAGRLIEQRFAHITWTPCTPHCLDLLLEDIGKLDWVSSVIGEAKKVRRLHLEVSFKCGHCLLPLLE